MFAAIFVDAVKKNPTKITRRIIKEMNTGRRTIVGILKEILTYKYYLLTKGHLLTIERSPELCTSQLMPRLQPPRLYRVWHIGE